MDRSLPGSSVHGIFQTRVLEWGAILHVILSNLLKLPIPRFPFSMKEGEHFIGLL